MKKKKIRWYIFLPSWCILIGAVFLYLREYTVFTDVIDATVGWILTNFSWLFNDLSLIVLILVVIAWFSPLGKVRIGGSKSRPIVSYRNYIWIVLCTIMGAGLMLWTLAEPLYHLHYPPSDVLDGAMSPGAVTRAMETILLEWTFTPMALYALPSILFAFCFYNMKRPFAVSSMLIPVIGDRRARKASPLVDGISLFCLCAGMAATLGSGVLIVSGGVESLSGGKIRAGARLWVIIGTIIIAAFVLSASTGLTKGIQHLSTLNSWFYLVLGILVLFAGPTAYILNLLAESFGSYLTNFFRLSLFTSASGDGWAQSWPVFYWCMSLAWMPVSGVFLGRVSRGYTVREALVALFFVPALFSVIWAGLFSGCSVYFETHGANLIKIVESSGIASATYAVLKKLPLSAIISPVFLATAFISYITSADSNTNVVAGLCTEGLDAEDSESPVWLKVVWGISIGALSLIMLTTYGTDGIKNLATIGGFPTAFLMIFLIVAFCRIMKNPARYDRHREDYTEDGVPIESRRRDISPANRKKEKLSHNNT